MSCHFHVLRLAAVAIGLLASGAAGCARPAPVTGTGDPVRFTAGPGDLVLDAVTVIPGDGTDALRDHAIVVRGERIAWVGPARRLRIDAAARTLPVQGAFVTPGFIDMHAHVAVGPVVTEVRDGVPAISMTYDEGASRAFTSRLLDHGVTTIRNPAGPAEHAVALRDAVNAGAWRGPRVFTAGEVLEQAEFPGLAAPVRTVDEVRREVDRQAALGVDIIKLYQTLTPELLKAGIDAAHAHGRQAIGHLMMTDWTTAAELGIDGIVHMLPASPELLPAPAREPYLAGIKGTQMMFQWFSYADIEAPEIARMTETLARENVHFDPTLVAVESLFFGDQPRITQNPALAGVPAALRDQWSSGSMTAGWSAEDFRAAHAAFDKALALTKKMYDAGVPLLAGTDVVMPWLAPGDSFHRELELLHAAGIAPRDVLRIATANGAAALNMQHELGSVHAGKRADLVVLDADPLRDIRNTRRIRHVIQNGAVVFTR